MSTPAARPSSGTSDPAVTPDRPGSAPVGARTGTPTGGAPGPGVLPHRRTSLLQVSSLTLPDRAAGRA
ncbi:hypothetical protein, partial [Cellulosimicrobium funkei]